jgi:hypothetical protein
MSLLKSNGTDMKSTLMIFFANNIALNVINDNEDQEPRSIKECRQSENWPKWKDAIEAELNSLNKRKVLDLFSEHLKA